MIRFSPYSTQPAQAASFSKSIRTSWLFMLAAAVLLLFAEYTVLPDSALCAPKEQSPLNMPMPEPLPPIPPLKKTSPTELNRQARKRIKASIERMRKIILLHRKMRGLVPVKQKNI